jgi:hypothetical protein
MKTSIESLIGAIDDLRKQQYITCKRLDTLETALVAKRILKASDIKDYLPRISHETSSLKVKQSTLIEFFDFENKPKRFITPLLREKVISVKVINENSVI